MTALVAYYCPLEDNDQRISLEIPDLILDLVVVVVVVAAAAVVV